MHAASPHRLLPFASRKLVVGVGILLAGAAAFLLFRVNPAEQLAWLPCPFHYFTGLYCPGCGSLRATHALLQGDFLQALSFNIIAVFAIPLLLGAGLLTLLRAVHNQPTTVHIPPTFARLVFWIILLFGIFRNLPFEISRLLQP